MQCSLRDAIDKFRGDRGTYPQSLQELVERQYLRKLPFDPVKDFAPVTLLAKTPNIVCLHPSLPAKSAAELISVARVAKTPLTMPTKANSAASITCPLS